MSAAYMKDATTLAMIASIIFHANTRAKPKTPRGFALSTFGGGFGLLPLRIQTELTATTAATINIENNLHSGFAMTFTPREELARTFRSSFPTGLSLPDNMAQPPSIVSG